MWVIELRGVEEHITSHILLLQHIWPHGWESSPWRSVRIAYIGAVSCGQARDHDWLLVIRSRVSCGLRALIAAIDLRHIQVRRGNVRGVALRIHRINLIRWWWLRGALAFCTVVRIARHVTTLWDDTVFSDAPHRQILYATLVHCPTALIKDRKCLAFLLNLPCLSRMSSLLDIDDCRRHAIVQGARELLLQRLRSHWDINVVSSGLHRAELIVPCLHSLSHRLLFVTDLLLEGSFGWSDSRGVMCIWNWLVMLANAGHEGLWVTQAPASRHITSNIASLQGRAWQRTSLIWEDWHCVHGVRLMLLHLGEVVQIMFDTWILLNCCLVVLIYPVHILQHLAIDILSSRHFMMVQFWCFEDVLNFTHEWWLDLFEFFYNIHDFVFDFFLDGLDLFKQVVCFLLKISFVSQQIVHIIN